jgi:hypothetical protein
MSNSNGQAQQVEIDLNEPVPIVLTFKNWNIILQMVAKAPWEIADPIMREMRAQIGSAIQPRLAPHARPNGEQHIEP